MPRRHRPQITAESRKSEAQPALQWRLTSATPSEMLVRLIVGSKTNMGRIRAQTIAGREEAKNQPCWARRPARHGNYQLAATHGTVAETPREVLYECDG